MTTVTLDTTLVASEEHTTTTVDDEVVILNTEQGLYQGLDGVGPRVWELLQEPKQARTIRDLLAVEYDVSPEECEADLLAFLAELAADGLIDVEDGSP
jgi:hypothetical protein